MKQRFSVNTACMGQRMTVRQTAAECGVAVSTAFRWRHRFLRAIVAQQPTAVEGLLEADETYFLLSMKGQRGLPRPARSRGGKAKRGLRRSKFPCLSRLRGAKVIQRTE
ncbi:MAG: helix-turn-helix domain-containing protein [Dechloromonas sp.]|nr:MAG: helix-turn-helix domain-containing protein [Dechloromonas sp.]